MKKHEAWKQIKQLIEHLLIGQSTKQYPSMFFFVFVCNLGNVSSKNDKHLLFVHLRHVGGLVSCMIYIISF